MGDSRRPDSSGCLFFSTYFIHSFYMFHHFSPSFIQGLMFGKYHITFRRPETEDARTPSGNLSSRHATNWIERLQRCFPTFCVFSLILSLLILFLCCNFAFTSSALLGGYMLTAGACRLAAQTATTRQPQRSETRSLGHVQVQSQAMAGPICEPTKEAAYWPDPASFFFSFKDLIEFAPVIELPSCIE